MNTSADHGESTSDLMARVRADLESVRVHFNHAGMSLTPRPVLTRVRAHLDLEAQIGGYEAAQQVDEEIKTIPAAIAPLFGPDVSGDEVALVDSASRAWELALWSIAETFSFTSDDRVVIDQFTYATVYATLHRLRVARGVQIDVAPARPDGTIDIERIGNMVTPNTRLVSITHMPTHMGSRADLEAIGNALAGTDAIFAVDAAQTLGHLPIDVHAIGCHVAFGPGRKFLRAPRGTGALYIDRALAERLVPLSPSSGVVLPSKPDSFELAVGARRFDAFEFGVAARLGMGVAARYALAIGLDRIAKLVAARSGEVVELCESTSGLRLVGSVDDVGIISFVHDRLSPDEVREHLATCGVNVWVNVATGAPLDGAARPVLPSVRVSPHYVTNADDIERLAGAFETLP
ncbi:MAG: aminotransferase class V-fold PLP-dependent enzyme [Actinomycetes bacterium]